MLTEAHRILKPGGELIMSVDSLATVREADVLSIHKEKYSVVRYYRSDELQKKLCKCGYSEIEIRSFLTSQFAARLFAAGVRNDFAYRYREAILLYFSLCIAERFSRGNAGIYLSGHARKH